MKSISGFLSLLVCMVLFVVELSVHGLFIAEKLTEKEAIASMVKETDIMAFFQTGNGESNAFRALSDTMQAYGISEEALQKMLQSDGSQAIVTEVMSMETDALLSSDTSKEIDSSVIAKLIEENSTELFGDSGLPVTPELKQGITESLAQSLGGSDGMFSLNSLIQPGSSLSRILAFLSSPTARYAMIGAIVVLTAFLVLLRWNFCKGIAYSAMVTLLSGGAVYLLAKLLSMNMVTSLLEKNLPAAYLPLATAFTTQLHTLLFVHGKLAMIIGIAVWVLMILLLILLPKKTNRIKSGNTIESEGN